MKVTTSKKLEQNFLGEKLLENYSYIDYENESDDGIRGKHSRRINCKVYGKIENETKNSDGTYTYEYSSRIESDKYGNIEKNPIESESDLNDMIKELMFSYNIHEFSTDIKEYTNIKDYYVSINGNAIYEKEKEPFFSYTWSAYSKNKANKNEEIFTSMDKLTLEELLSKDAYILYLLGNKVKNYMEINIGLDEIREYENVTDFLEKIKLKSFEIDSLEEALEKNIITLEDIQKVILRNKNLEIKGLPNDILIQMLDKNPELVSCIGEEKIPIDILRKYDLKFDISKINPEQLISSDLDNVLENVIKDKLIIGKDGGPSEKELKQGYLEYLKKFYNNKEALKKIIPVINTSSTYFFKENAKEYIDNIPEKIMGKDEIRDILLDTDTDKMKLSQLLKYNFNYDTNSSKKMLKFIGDNSTKISLNELNQVIEILQKNGINNEEILNSLRDSKFNISNFDEEEIKKFKSFGIKGITVEDITDRILESKDFKYLKLVDEDLEDNTKVYNICLKEIEKKSNNKDESMYNKIYDLIFNYQNVTELFSKLNPEVKELTKKLIINTIDLNEKLQNKSIKYSNEYQHLLTVIFNSFDITQEDMVNIYMKILNNGSKKEDIICKLNDYMTDKEKNEFEKSIANIYPNPKHSWIYDKNVKRICVGEKENRNTVKNKIQSDRKCFSIKIKTDMVGEDKDGKKIIVNNLSKWLFGVPGAKGNLIVRSNGYDKDIILPSNTPNETIELIENIMNEKGIEK